MSATRLPLTATLQNLPPVWPDDPLPAIRAALAASQAKLVVLDDDPTGTQTVHGIPVLTTWSVQALQAELANDLPVCFLLTNSRSLALPAAQALNTEIGHNLHAAAELTGRRFAVVSRSDSTLRGHFPGEVEALATALGEEVDSWLLVPFFLEGGRYTIDDTHYVAEGDTLVPAGETESARDAAFGYRASNLRQWVEEKSQGRIPATRVTSVSLDDIRRGGPQQVTTRLTALQRGSVCVINAASSRDMEVVVLGLLEAEARGKRFVYRTAASFVPVRGGVTQRDLLTPAEITAGRSGGGLTIVGSHVPRSSSQLEHLRRQPGIVGIEVAVAALLDGATRQATIARMVQRVDAELQGGMDVVLFTSRQLLTGHDAESSLAISQQVSAGLVAILQTMTAAPRYILAKGGITSSDLATQGLGVQRAMVLGQILPGVPVWQLGPETRYPGLSYIVFPGNVGGPEALSTIVHNLRQS